MDAAGAPILVGLLHDFPQIDGGASFEAACRLGVEEAAAGGRIDRAVHFITRQARGLPLGTAHELEAAFTELVGNGVVAMVGPSISDNAYVIKPVADALGVPTINYSGGEKSRSEFLFHYQVGSLAEEPVVLAEHLVLEGRATVAAVYDRSPVGRGYMEAFEAAAARAGIEMVARAPISPIADGRVHGRRPVCQTPGRSRSSTSAWGWRRGRSPSRSTKPTGRCRSSPTRR